MRYRRLLRIPVFALVTLLVLLWVQKVFCIRDYSIDSRERGFKMEKKKHGRCRLHRRQSCILLF